jgi:hypothetical protein
MSEESYEYSPAEIAALEAHCKEAFGAHCPDERLSGGERPNWAVRLSAAQAEQLARGVSEWLKTHPESWQLRLDFATNDYGTVTAWEVSALK